MTDGIDAFDTQARARVGAIPDADAFDIAVEPDSGNLANLLRNGIAAHDASTLKPR